MWTLPPESSFSASAFQKLSWDTSSFQNASQKSRGLLINNRCYFFTPRPDGWHAEVSEELDLTCVHLLVIIIHMPSRCSRHFRGLRKANFLFRVYPFSPWIFNDDPSHPRKPSPMNKWCVQTQLLKSRMSTFPSTFSTYFPPLECELCHSFRFQKSHHHFTDNEQTGVSGCVRRLTVLGRKDIPLCSRGAYGGHGVGVFCLFVFSVLWTPENIFFLLFLLKSNYDVTFHKIPFVQLIKNETVPGLTIKPQHSAHILWSSLWLHFHVGVSYMFFFKPHYWLIAFCVLKVSFSCVEKKIICLLMGCQICFPNLLKGHHCYIWIRAFFRINEKSVSRAIQGRLSAAVTWKS